MGHLWLRDSYGKVSYCFLGDVLKKHWSLKNILLQCALEPTSDVCGNGIVEGNEECDCGSSDAEECFQADPCCTPGNCTLRAGANCRYICLCVCAH